MYCSYSVIQVLGKVPTRDSATSHVLYLYHHGIYYMGCIGNNIILFNKWWTKIRVRLKWITMKGIKQL